MKLELDDEELQSVIEFQRSMIADANDSCEFEEAERRTKRLAELEALARTTG